MIDTTGNRQNMSSLVLQCDCCCMFAKFFALHIFSRSDAVKNVARCEATDQLMAERKADLPSNMELVDGSVTGGREEDRSHPAPAA